jgi:hypothetical protein
MIRKTAILLTVLWITGCSKTIDNTGTCHDGIRNQGEQGIDCGGPCPVVCANCGDGIMNQGETAVDCGGPCDPCYPLLSAKINQSQWFSTSRTAQLTGSGQLRIFGTGQMQNITLEYSGPFQKGTYPAGQLFHGTFVDESGNYYSSVLSGSISFSTIDTVARKLSGTFKLSIRDTVNLQSVSITNGIFTSLNY